MRKGITFVIFLFIICVQLIHAQITVSGYISDLETKEAIPGVMVTLADLKSGTLSDDTGNYQFTDLKPGNYLFEVSSFGYKPIVLSVSIEKDTVLDFSLSISAKEISEVIVTGVSRSTELKMSPIVITTIDKNKMNENASTNLIDALKNVPGVSQITTGASISKPIIRGLGYNRVISLNNGIRQEGQQWGDEHGIEIDEYSIDRIEIVKGPGSLMYGSDGIAGVLNFISPKAPPLGEVKTNVVTNYQSNNNLIGYSLSNAGNKNGFQWMGRFSNKFAGDYQNKYDGKVSNSGFREFDGSLFLGINKRWGHSHVTISSYNNTLNLPEGERDSLGHFTFENSAGEEVSATKNDLKGYHIGFPHQTINHFRVSSNNYFLLKKGTLNLDVAFQNNRRKEYGSAVNPDAIDLFFDLYTANYNIRYNLREMKGWETSIGIGGMEQSNRNKGLEVLIPEYDLFDVGVFVSTQKTFFKKLTFAAGLRLDNRIINSHSYTEVGEAKTKFESFTKDFYGISGSVGLSYQPTKHSTIKFNVSRGFRAPNLAELAANGRHEGTFRYEIGNPNLKPEISHQIDLAYFLDRDHISFELTPFVNFIGNYVYAQKLQGINGGDSIPDPTEPASAYAFTQGNAVLWGGEIYFDIHPHPLDWLHLANSFSYVQATQSKQPDSLKYLPFIPAPKYRGEIKAEFKKVGKALSNVYVKFAVDYYFKQNHYFSAYNTETATPAYTLLSAGIGADIKAFKRKDFFSLYVSMENIANTAYQSHLNRLKYAPENLLTGRQGIYNMGRNLSVKLILNI